MAAVVCLDTAAAILFIGSGLIWAFFSAADYQQGESVRIIYVHVPAAWMSLSCYPCIALASASALIWRHPLGDLIARPPRPSRGLHLHRTGQGSLWASPWGRPGGCGMPG